MDAGLVSDSSAFTVTPCVCSTQSDSLLRVKMGIFGSSSRKEINWINTIKGGKMSTGHSAPVMLKTMLFLLLLKGVISNNDEIKCQRNLQLAEKALADVYVVDRSSDIARVTATKL